MPRPCRGPGPRRPRRSRRGGKRSTPTWRAASSMVWVPSTLVRKKSPGFSTARELCDSAAKWTMVSIRFAPQRLLGRRRIADVPLDEHDLVFDVGQVGSVAGIGEHVVDDDMVLGVLLHPVTGEIRPDETGTSRDEKAHTAADGSPGPRPPPGSNGPEWTMSPAVTARGLPPSRPAAARLVDPDRPAGELLRGQDDQDLLAQGGAAGPDLVGQPGAGPPPGRAGAAGTPRAAKRCSSRTIAIEWRQACR